MFLAFLAVFACAVPALAFSVDNYETWNVNATFGGSGGSLSGSFVIDTTQLLGGNAYAVSGENITISGPAVTDAGGVSGFVFSPSSVAVAFIGGTPDLFLAAGTLSGGTYVIGSTVYEMVLDVVATPGDRAVFAGTAPLTLTSSSNIETILNYGEGDQEDPTIQISAGTLAAVPLPPAAFLLGTGLMALAWARRQKLLGNG